MDIYLFSILLLVAIVLLLLTFFKKQIIVGIFTGIFFLLLGVVCWTGINYVSSTTITQNTTTMTTTVINNYSEWSNPVVAGFTDNEIVGTCFVLLGLFLLVISSVMTFSGRKRVDLGDESAGGDEDES